MKTHSYYYKVCYTDKFKTKRTMRETPFYDVHVYLTPKSHWDNDSRVMYYKRMTKEDIFLESI